MNKKRSMREEKPISIPKMLLMFVALILIVSTIITLVSKPNVDKEIAMINDRLEYATIRYAPGAFIIPRAGEQALAKPLRSLIITINEEYIEKVVHFEVMQYTSVTTGGRIGRLPQPIKDLFLAIDQVYNKENKLIEAIGEIEVSADFAKRFNANTKLKALAEMLYSIQRLIRIKTNRVDIYVRGYADGQEKDWSLPLEKGYDGDEYQNFAVSPPKNPYSKNPIHFYKTGVNYAVPDNYKNEHLPNLRARFIQLDIIEPFIKQHLVNQGVSDEDISIGILGGYEFKHRNSLDRKVEIYVNIY